MNPLLEQTVESSIAWLGRFDLAPRDTGLVHNLRDTSYRRVSRQLST